MSDQDKTKEQLIAELEELRQFLSNLKTSDKKILQEVEDRFANILAIAQDAIISIGENHHIIHFNQGAEKIFGYQADEVIGKSLNILIPKRFSVIHSQHIRDFATSPIQSRYMENRGEIAGQHKDGSEIPLEASISKLRLEEPVIFTAILRDITERKRYQDALRESEEKYHALIEYASDSIFISDPNTQHLLDINESAARRLGYTREELLQLSISDLAPDFSTERLDANIRALKKGESLRFEAVHQRKDGTKIPVEITTRIVRYGSQDVIQSFTRDITERKQAEEELQQLFFQLENKNTELEYFTYTVSHDLKNPIISIKGFLGYLEKDVLDGNIEEVKEDITYITNAADRMNELLDDLLALSRVGHRINHPEPVPLNDIVEEAIELVKGLLDQHNISPEVMPNLPIVHVDRVRIREVFENLISNAAKYNHKQSDSRIEIGVREDGDETLIYVQDNGIGIDPKYHETVFGLFNQLNQSIEGTGVGLAIVKRIVEAHNGRIWVESDGQGRGSTFYFTLAANIDTDNTEENAT